MASTGEIRAKLTLIADEFTAELERIRREIDRLNSDSSGKLGAIGKSFDKVGKNISGMGKAIVGAFTPAIAVAATSTKQFLDYEQAVLHLNKTTNMSEGEMAKFKQAAKGIADQLGLTETAVVDLSAQVAAYGIEGTQNILDVVKVAQQMSQSFEGVDASTAISQVAKFVSVTGIGTEKVKNYGSAIAYAEDNTAALAPELLNANNRVAAVGTAFGLSADEITAFDAILLSAGMTPELVGTNFSKFIGRMSRDLATGGKNAETFASVAGMSLEGFNNLLKTDSSEAIGAFIKGLNEMEANGGNVDSVLQSLSINGQGEIRTVKSLMAAYQSQNGEVSKAEDLLSNLNTQYEKGSKLQGDFEKTTKTLEFSLQEVKSNISDLGVAIGQALAPSVGDVATKINDLVLKVTDFVNKNPELVRQFADIAVKGIALGASLTVVGKTISGIGKIFTGIGTIVGGVAKAFRVVSSVVSFVAPAFKAVGAAILGLNPVVLVVVGVISALVAAFVYCWNHVEGFKEGVINAWNAIKDGVSAAIDFVINLFNSFVATVSTVWNSITSAISTACSAVWSVVTIIWNNVVSFLTGLWTGIVSIASTIWNGITTAISTACNAVWSVIEPIWTMISTLISTICNNVWEVVKFAWDLISNIISNVCTVVGAIVEATWNNIKVITSAVFNAVKSVVTSVWNGIKSIITSVVNAVKPIVTAAWNAIKSVTSSVFNAVKGVVSGVWNGIKSTVTTVVNGVKSAVSTAWNGIKSATSSAFNTVKSVATTAWNGVKNAIIKPIQSAKEKVLGIIDKITGAFSKMKIKIPKFKLPHINVGWNEIGDTGIKIPKLSISWNAKGRFLDGAQLIGAGEAGKEAILPLENKRYMAPFASAVSDNLMDNRGIGSAAQSVTISITNNNTINSDMDIRRVSEQLTAYTEREMRRKGIITGRPKYSR